MNKVILIGVPVAVVAVIAVMLVMKPTVSTIENTKVAVAPVEQQPTPEKAAPAAPVAVNTASSAGNVDTSSIDSITAGFLADANADTSSVVNDTSDQMAVNTELATYNTVKSTSYEIAI